MLVFARPIIGFRADAMFCVYYTRLRHCSSLRRMPGAHGGRIAWHYGRHKILADCDKRHFFDADMEFCRMA